jgi:hypothetical protein
MMKLLLLWLLGVPVAVSSMVMAQSWNEGERILKRMTEPVGHLPADTLISTIP